MLAASITVAIATDIAAPLAEEFIRIEDMEHATDIERRLTELEIKAGFAEDLLDTLNAMVARQQETIETLVREVARLRERQSPEPDDAQSSLRDEIPPHY